VGVRIIGERGSIDSALPQASYVLSPEEASGTQELLLWGLGDRGIVGGIWGSMASASPISLLSPGHKLKADQAWLFRGSGVPLSPIGDHHHDGPEQKARAEEGPCSCSNCALLYCARCPLQPTGRRPPRRAVAVAPPRRDAWDQHLASVAHASKWSVYPTWTGGRRKHGMERPQHRLHRQVLLKGGELHVCPPAWPAF
jgi:hypothetical protein